jgi:hypothetical protein
MSELQQQETEDEPSTPSFKLESHSRNQVAIRNLEDDHLFTFSVVPGPKGPELSLSNVLPGPSGAHAADMMVGWAVAFAITEARAKGSIR